MLCVGLLSEGVADAGAHVGDGVARKVARVAPAQLAALVGLCSPHLSVPSLAAKEEVDSLLVLSVRLTAVHDVGELHLGEVDVHAELFGCLPHRRLTDRLASIDVAGGNAPPPVLVARVGAPGEEDLSFVEEEHVHGWGDREPFGHQADRRRGVLGLASGSYGRAMDFGLYGLHRGSSVDPDVLRRRALLAEEAGFESLWVGDHVAVPAGDPDDDDRLEAVAALTFLAAVTRRVRLAAGVLILPQRHPVLLAKQVGTLDLLSGGRLSVGIGVGHVEEELAAFGVDLSERGARTDEALAVLRTLWEDEVASFDGRWTSFSDLVQRPRPVQQPHPPIIVGGHAGASLVRAVMFGDGWFGWELDVEQTATTVARLRALEEEAERATALEITIKPDRVPDADLVGEYAEAGVSRLVVQPEDSTGDEIEHLITAVGDLIASP